MTLHLHEYNDSRPIIHNRPKTLHLHEYYDSRPIIHNRPKTLHLHEYYDSRPIIHKRPMTLHLPVREYYAVDPLYTIAPWPYTYMSTMTVTYYTQ